VFRLDETTYISRKSLKNIGVFDMEVDAELVRTLTRLLAACSKLTPTRFGLGNISASPAEHFVRCTFSIGPKQKIGSDQFSLSI
jgi:hypothetical protein